MDEKALVLAAQRGDERSFVSLLDRYLPRGYAVARLILRNSADAEDATQSACLLAFKRINQLKDPHAFDPWFIRIVANEAKAILRRQPREAVIDERVLGMSEQKMDITEARLDLQAALELLPEFHNIVLRLKYSGLTSKEVARTLNRPSGTIRRVISESYAILRRLLGTNYPE